MSSIQITKHFVKLSIICILPVLIFFYTKCGSISTVKYCATGQDATVQTGTACEDRDAEAEEWT
ncbi:hypothetical protein [Gimesia maris]|uniref:hypothetical protein n=1 Tax=Gimesia maris TaxID=122 RepID=UPI0005C6D6E8|nr:hypothetical protein [Gimesia maris]